MQLSSLFSQVDPWRPFVNWQSYEGQCKSPARLSLLTTFRFHFINDPPRNILRALVNICADDNTVYGRISPNQDTRLSLFWPSSKISMNKKLSLVSGNASKPNLISFCNRRSDTNFSPVTMKDFSMKLSRFRYLLVHEFIPNEEDTDDQLLKILENEWIIQSPQEYMTAFDIIYRYTLTANK